MKAISLWQPWSSLVVHGFKRVETRHWATDYRGRLLIHAAKHWTKAERETTAGFFSAYPETRDAFPLDSPRCGQVFAPGTGQAIVVPLGAIVGSVDLTHCAGMTEEDCASFELEQPREYALGNWQPGRFAWILENPVAYETPVPYKGLQSLFSVPDDLVPEEQARTWDLKHTVGTPVRYWAGLREGPGVESRTRSQASTLCGHAVVWVEGQAGCMALSHVEAL